MELLFVHLTDMHIQSEDDYKIISTRIDSISGAINMHVTDPDNTTIFFCVTGDFAFAGKEEQLLYAGLFIEEIQRKIQNRFEKITIHTIFVPGNHDCDFEDPGNSVREAILSSPTLNISDPEQMKLCTGIQKNFFEFAKTLPALYAKEDKVLTVNEVRLEKENISVKFHCINTSWCSARKENKGKMRIKFDDIPDREPGDIVVTMMHHDAEWLDWDDKDAWDEYHKRFSDIILVGHDHKAEFVVKQNFNETTNYYIKGNQLYDKGTPLQSGFNILKVKTKENIECFFTYELRDQVYTKVIDTGYRPFIRNRFVSSGVELKKEVVDYLENLDFDLTNKKRKVLKLSDVFSFPTLREEKQKGTRFLRDMDSAMAYFSEKKYVSIRGLKEYGKTALLKQLFSTYFKQNKYPVFLDISKINTGEGEALNRIVAQRYADTYDNINVDEVMQKDPADRICFIDNFERISLQDKTAKKFLQYLTNQFGIVIISRNPSHDLINPLSYVEMNDFIHEKFEILSIQPVKNTSKERLITNWLCMGDDNIDKSSPAFDAMRKEKYAQVQTVMQGGYFNRTPLDLLLVLSYLDQDNPAQINYSRYSYIYDSLILDKLTAIGKKDTTTISMYRMILQQLAYKMYMDGKDDYVDEMYVFKVVHDYKEHYSVKTKAADIVQNLVGYKFLDTKDDQYRFKYNYMYYYFAGSYIEQKLPPEEKTEVIKNIFDNIYDDINYNIAMFLSYSTNKEHVIMPLVKATGESLLSEFADFDYDSMKKMLEEWRRDIDKQIEKIYEVPENSNIPVLRERKMRELEEKEESASKTDEEVRRQNWDVTKLMRLVDFTGNMLKNYCGEMSNDFRAEAIGFIFNSANRIIGSFCSFSMYVVEKIIDMIETKIEEGDEKIVNAKTGLSQIIKYLFSEILQEFIGENIAWIASDLDCDIIKPNIDDFVDNYGTDLVRMTRMEYLMRIAQTRLPIKDIRELFEGKDALDDFSQAIMKHNIWRFMSGYQFDYKDKCTACSILKFNIKDVVIEEQKTKAIAEKS